MTAFFKPVKKLDASESAETSHVDKSEPAEKSDVDESESAEKSDECQV